MPWQEVCPMDVRMRFVAAVRAEEDSMRALCEEYGISRRIGYKWLARYQSEGPAGLQERRRGPRRVPWAITIAQAEAIIELRRRHQSWGPKKLCAKLRADGSAVIQDGLDNLNKAISLREDYDDAMAYVNLLYREKADLECETPGLRAEDLKTADEWVDRTLAVKKAKANRHPAPTAPSPQ